jgi:ataxia telangiectasia mutated family protein
LQALRSHKEALLTVVEVVLHDPMYKWQMTPVKAQRRQQDPLAGDAGAAGPAGTAAGTAASSGGASSAGGPAGSGAAAIGNADAERAVLRVKQKLEGQDVEGGVAMSVAAQVGKWLQDAQDPDRLCRMFVGWAAWQ